MGRENENYEKKWRGIKGIPSVLRKYTVLRVYPTTATIPMVLLLSVFIIPGITYTIYVTNL